jgi:PAS domain S-box-containing protein
MAGGMVVVAAGGAIAGCDAHACALFGYDEDDLSQLAFGELIAASGNKRDSDAIQRLAAGQAPSSAQEHYRIRGRRRDHGEFFVDLLITPMSGGTARGFVASFGAPSERARDRPRWFAEEQRWRTLLEEFGDTFFFWDLKTDDVEFSRSWLDSMDYAPHELATSAAWFALLHPDDRNRVKGEIGACVDGLVDRFECEFRLQRKSGDYRWILAGARIIDWFSDHESPLMAGFYRDTTTKRRALEKLAKSEIRREQALSGSRLGVWDWDLITGETFFSAEWKRMSGYEPGDLEPTIDTWRTLALPEDLAASDAAIGAHLAGETSECRAECRTRDRNGGSKWVLDRGQIVERAPDGKPLRMIGTHDDITRLKIRETEIAESRERLSRIASLIPGMVYQFELTADGHMRFAYTSEGIQEIFGVSPEQALRDASIVFEKIHPDDVDAVVGSIPQSAATLSLWDMEFRLRETHDEDERWLHGVANPQPGPAGDGTVLWHGYVSEITERKRTTLALQQRSLAVQLANEDLEQFNYIAAHDLKEPLRSIRHLGDWIADELPADVPESVTENLERLQLRASRLGALIEGLAEYSRAGRRDVQLTKVDPVVTARELADEIDSGGCRVDVIGEVGNAFSSSAVALQTVLRNLLVNAIVHHHDAANGHISVTVESAPTHVVITVEDDGPGIDAAHHERVFKMYQQLDPESGKSGTGSGLAIVKRIINSVGSSIKIESPITDGGTRFRFAWPGTWPHD